MLLFAQLAFDSTAPAPLRYLAGMTQSASSYTSLRWRSAVSMLGRSLMLLLLLMALVSIGMVACGDSSGDTTPTVQSQVVQPVVAASAGSSGSSGTSHAAVMLTTTFTLQVTELNTGLSSPWGLAFLPDDRMLVTEKAGTMKLLAANGSTVGVVSGVAPV